MTTTEYGEVETTDYEFAEGVIITARFIGLADLLAGIGFGIYAIVTMSDIEVPHYLGHGLTMHQTNPTGIILGVALIAQGIVVCNLLWLLGTIVERLGRIADK